MTLLATQARRLLLEISEDPMSSRDKLLLSRIDLLWFRALKVTPDEFVSDHVFLRDAMKYISGGVDCFGGT